MPTGQTETHLLQPMQSPALWAELLHAALSARLTAGLIVGDDQAVRASNDPLKDSVWAEVIAELLSAPDEVEVHHRREECDRVVRRAAGVSREEHASADEPADKAGTN